jgi:hypothetical protein
MNSLPLISHHLFVAAVGSQDRAPTKSARLDVSDREVCAERPSAVRPLRDASVILLEVVADGRCLPVAGTRLLQASVLAGG